MSSDGMFLVWRKLFTGIDAISGYVPHAQCSVVVREVELLVRVFPAGVPRGVETAATSSAHAGRN